MGVTWTKEQQKVIDLRNRNILVSAAAGSGKTAVLVERIIQMLLDKEHPMDVDELLVVTFTEAAAAEMKERIRAAIEKALLDDIENAHLQAQASLIHSAQITTIHSFCLSVIRDHFHAIDLDPGFRIAEEGERKLLMHDTLEELLEEKYQEADPDFLDFTMAYGTGRSDKKIEELILKIYEYSRSYPDPQDWLEACVQKYDFTDVEELERSEVIGQLKKMVLNYKQDMDVTIDQAIDICEGTGGPYMYSETLMKEKEMLAALENANTYSGFYQVLSGISFGRIPQCRDKSVDKGKKEQVQHMRGEVKDMVKELQEDYFALSPEETLENITACKVPVKVLKDLVLSYAAKLTEKKRSQNMIDFSDMEHYALQILTEKKDGDFIPSMTAREYQEHFKEIMIDEYQDSNLIQEKILTSISTVSEGRYNIFMVGDVKQSIYRFRLSRPELFMDKYHRYSTEDSETQRIDLHKNFRSRKEVIDSVNAICSKLMTKALGGIDYDADSALYLGADYYPEAEGMQTEMILACTDSEVVEKPAAKEHEAMVIANRIKELLRTQKIQDKATGEMRPVRYKDIVILLRSVSGYADIFSEILMREGIPVHVGSREGYFGAYEVGVLLDYLRVLDNRRQDLPLTAVLTSPLCGLNEENLAQIKVAHPDVPFWRAVALVAEEGAGQAGACDCAEKLRRCFKQLDTFREMVPYTPMHELILKILDRTGYGDFIAAMPGGEQRYANLEMLVEKARTYESTSYKGLFHFIRYIEQLQKYEVDYGEADIQDEQSDTVRIMTIHKSKGLEFPVVFVSGMGKQFNLMDAKNAVVLHSGMGIGLDAVDLNERTRTPSLIKKMIIREEEQDTRAEELRVLYVALTRAKEKLIITAAVSNLEKKLDEAGLIRLTSEGTLPYMKLSKASGYLPWLLPAVTHSVQDAPVTFEVVMPEDALEEAVQEMTVQTITRESLQSLPENLVYDEQMHRALEEQFGYQYPYAQDGSHKLKFSVSELKKRAYLEESGQMPEQEGEMLYEEPVVVPLIPDFLQTEVTELTGALRGTAYHRLFELLPYEQMEAGYSEEKLEADLAGFLADGHMTEEMVSCIRKKDIRNFLQTRSAARMILAAKQGRLYKEQPFVLGIPEREMYPEGDDRDRILVQGIIDVYFEEDGELVVLDYKTDKVSTGRELLARYHAQLDYYARALEQITGKKVKEKIIYSVTLNTEILIDR